jgi:putative membrane protein
MKRLLTSVWIDGMAFYFAIQLVPGIRAPDDFASVGLVIILFIMFSTVIRPMLWLLTCAPIVVFFGPLLLGINSLLFWLNAWLADQLRLGFTVEGFAAALGGAMVVSIVRIIALYFFRENEKCKSLRTAQAGIRHLERTKAWLEEQRDTREHTAG